VASEALSTKPLPQRDRASVRDHLKVTFATEVETDLAAQKE
jgi:hypothetical protein